MQSTDCEIHILTGDIQTGKSSELQKWVEEKKLQGLQIDGLLNLVIKSQKHFYKISSKTYWPMEDLQAMDTGINIGRYTFSSQAFQKARHALDHKAASSGIFIIDEIGKLELQNRGLEPSLSSFIKRLPNTSFERLILVVRDSLVKEVIEHYQLKVQSIMTKEGLYALN